METWRNFFKISRARDQPKFWTLACNESAIRMKANIRLVCTNTLAVPTHLVFSKTNTEQHIKFRKKIYEFGKKFLTGTISNIADIL